MPLAWRVCLAAAAAVTMIKGLDGAAGDDPVTIKDHGYRNVLVAISSSVMEVEAPDDTLIEGIKKAMTKLSKAMKLATRGRLYLADVTILLPKSWQGDEDFEAATTENYKDSQIRVLPPNPVYGDQPYTVQPGGCGEPGLYMHLTTRYLRKNDVACRWGNVGKVLMREWARLRWGVFDELGYKDDPIFPLYYLQANDSGEPSLVPNFCHDAHIRGEYKNPASKEKCEVGKDEECRFVPVYLQHATSSLMSNYHLPNVHQFCDSESKTHHDRAPTRHNLLCDGKSVWEVIRKHPDLEKNKSKISEESSREPRFKIVREVPPKYVVALETTKKMTDSTMVSKLKARLKRWLRKEISNESSVGLVWFGQNMDIVPLKIVGEGSNRKDLIKDIDALKEQRGSPKYEEAVREAMEMLGSNLSNSVILLVASGDRAYYRSVNDVENANKTNFNCLVLQKDGEGIGKLNDLTNRANGEMFTVEQDKEEETVNDFIQAARRAQPQSYGTNTIVIQDSKFKGLQIPTDKLKRMFHVEEGVKDLNLTLTTLDPSDIFTRPILISPSEDEFSSISSRQKTKWSVIVTSPEYGTWSWEVELTSNKESQISVVISAQTTTQMLPLQVDAWMNAKGGTFDASAKHLHLFTRVRKDESPVTGATVRALVSQDNATADPEEVQLLDVGGGSDTMAGDGIYSRSFTFKEKDVYYFKVEVSSNNSTYYKTDSFQHDSLQDTGYLTRTGCSEQTSQAFTLCCGSAVPSNPHYEERTQAFSRVLSLGSVKVTSVSSTLNTLQPSRVWDLQVIRARVNRLSLSWTAPGGENNRGNVSSYEFLLTTKYEDLPETPEAGGNPHLRLTYPKDEENDVILLEFGQPTSLTLNLTEHLQKKRLYYLVVRSKNKAGKTSALSNVVRLTPEVDKEEIVEDWRDSGIKWYHGMYVCMFIFCLASCMC